MNFRKLRADEIDVRVATCSASGVSLLLYKDARCDMNILDETVGTMNWQRHHSRDNANCIVSIWDADKKMWIEKEDTGTESFTEKEKGLASDSFKRACFNLGIGRELYTAPFIWVNAPNLVKYEKDAKTGKWKCNDRFSVSDIDYNNGVISKLTILDTDSKKEVFWYGTKTKNIGAYMSNKISTEDAENIKYMLEQTNSDVTNFLKNFKVKSVEDMTTDMLEKANRLLSNKWADMQKGK